MDLVTFNTSIYFFLIVSLLVWFLRILHTCQLWVFFFFADLLISHKYFYFFKKYARGGFLLLYSIYIFFNVVVVNPLQTALFLLIFSLKKTKNRYLANVEGRGLASKSLETVFLYMPVSLVTANSAKLVSLQMLVKALSIPLVFTLFNALV